MIGQGFAPRARVVASGGGGGDLPPLPPDQNLTFGDPTEIFLGDFGDLFKN